MNSSFKLALAASAVAMVAFTGPAAHAAFGPATGGISINGTPTVNTSTHVVNFSSIPLFWTSGTGSLTGVSGGAINGSINFDPTAGNSVSNSVTSFVTTSNSSSTFTFDVTKVTTVSYSYVPNVSGSFSLYVLGTMGDQANPSGYTNTSLTFTGNNTGGSTWTASATLANPPSPVPPPPPPPPPPSVPEPATLSLLGTALVGLGALRRRKR